MPECESRAGETACLSQSCTRFGKRPQGTLYEKGRSIQDTSKNWPSGEGAKPVYMRVSFSLVISPVEICAAKSSDDLLGEADGVVCTASTMLQHYRADG